MSARALRRFGGNVRQERRRLGLSQDELAERTGSHRNYIGGIERGERNPTLVKIVALAQGLGVGFDRLMAGLLDIERGRSR